MNISRRLVPILGMVGDFWTDFMVDLTQGSLTQLSDEESGIFQVVFLPTPTTVKGTKGIL